MPANFVPCIHIVSYVGKKIKCNVPVHLMSAYVGSRDMVPFSNLDSGCM